MKESLQKIASTAKTKKENQEKPLLVSVSSPSPSPPPPPPAILERFSWFCSQASKHKKHRESKTYSGCNRAIFPEAYGDTKAGTQTVPQEKKTSPGPGTHISVTKGNKEDFFPFGSRADRGARWRDLSEMEERSAEPETRPETQGFQNTALKPLGKGERRSSYVPSSLERTFPVLRSAFPKVRCDLCPSHMTRVSMLTGSQVMTVYFEGKSNQRRSKPSTLSAKFRYVDHRQKLFSN